MQPITEYSITAKALIGDNPPNSIPQNSSGRVANANADRLAMVGEMTASRLLRINGIRACHFEAPLPIKKSYCARL